MQSINVNGHPISPDLLDDMTVGRAVQFINEVGSKSNSIVTQIFLNGEEIEIDELATKPVSIYSHIDFVTKSKASLAFDCLDSCKQYINIIIEKIKVIVGQYDDGQFSAANNTFIEIVEITEIFVQLFTKINITLKNSFGDKYIKSKDSQALEISLINILKEIYRAKETSDTIALCDLLEYELTDNLNLWKKVIIPEIERLKDH